MTNRKPFFDGPDPDELLHLMDLINMEDIFKEALFPGWSYLSSAVEVWDEFAPDDYYADFPL
jgi:hypothetical protein